MRVRLSPQGADIYILRQVNKRLCPLVCAVSAGSSLWWSKSISVVSETRMCSAMDGTEDPRVCSATDGDRGLRDLEHSQPWMGTEDPEDLECAQSWMGQRTRGCAQPWMGTEALALLAGLQGAPTGDDLVAPGPHLQMGSIPTWGYRSLRALLRGRICYVTLGHGNTGLLVGPSNPLPQCPLSLFHPQWLEGPHA